MISLTDTIAAISTAMGASGIGIVRLSGPEAIEIASKAFQSKSPLTEENNRKLLYGHIVKEDKVLDEVLLAPFFKPNTYTRENMAEINCHGGQIAVNLVLEYMLELGCRLAEPGEFTKRAFLNGRLDLSQAEAVIDLIDAHSKEGYSAGIDQLEGSLSRFITKDREKLVNMMALIEANIDFPTDEIEEANNTKLIEQGEELLQGLKELRSTSSRGRLLREGISTVIVGKPNVGKSSLLNAFLRENRAIVTDIPGTTRDIIEEYVNLDGVTLKIKDTAGIRSTEDVVEQIGVEMAESSIKQADLVIALFDSSKALESEDYRILDLVKDQKSIYILNKSDLESKIGIEDLKEAGAKGEILTTSLLEAKGVVVLEDKIKEAFSLGEISSNNQAMITNLRHRRALDKAIESVESAVDALHIGIPIDCVEVDLNDAYNALGEITGETIEEEILDKIFSDFCIGK